VGLVGVWTGFLDGVDFIHNSGWGLIEVMGARELPICSATSCCIKDVDKLVINIMIEALSAEESTKGEDV